MRKIVAFVVLLFFSIHIFEPGKYFFRQINAAENHFGHSHSEKSDHKTSHNHPCCTSKTIDAVFWLSGVVVLFVFDAIQIEYVSILLLVFIFVRYSSRAPPSFI